MAQEIIWSSEAYRDLERIHQFVSRDSPAAAMSLAERIVAAIERLQDFPLLGPQVRE